MIKNLDELGTELKIRQSSLLNDYLSLYEEKITKKNNNSFRLLLITNQHVDVLAKMYSTRFPDAEIVAVSYSQNFNVDSKFRDGKITYFQFTSLDNMLLNAVNTGYFDVIIEHCDNKKSHKIRILKKYYCLLNVNGLFFIEELHAKFNPHLSDCDGDDVIDILGKAANIKISTPEYKKNSDAFLVTLAETCESISIRGKLGVIEKNRNTLRGLTNSEGIELLLKGVLSGDTLYKNDNAYVNEFKNNFISYPERNSSRYRKKFVIRETYINKFEDVICEPGQIAYQGNFLLPDTFRIQYSKTLSSSKIKNLYKNVFLDNGKSITKVLDGKYLYLDSEYPCHFGHFISEVISRLWAWDKIKEHEPDLKVLIGLGKEKIIPTFVLEILECYGIKKDDIVTFDDCVSIKMLYTASPYFSRDHVNPAVLPIWDRIGKKATSGITEIKENKLFLARPANGIRKCLNSEKLESIFIENGFELYNPENHSWLDQVKKFSQAKVIAGYAGSAVLNSIFSSSIQFMIIIGASSFINPDEQFVCETKGIELHRFWGDPLFEHGNTWSSKAYHSDYNFNYERDENTLLELLKNI